MIAAIKIAALAVSFALISCTHTSYTSTDVRAVIEVPLLRAIKDYIDYRLMVVWREPGPTRLEESRAQAEWPRPAYEDGYDFTLDVW